MTENARPERENFDCVAFQRARCRRLDRMFATMNDAEINAWWGDYSNVTDPILRDFVDRVQEYQAWKEAADGSDPPADERPPGRSPCWLPGDGAPTKPPEGEGLRLREDATRHPRRHERRAGRHDVGRAA